MYADGSKVPWSCADRATPDWSDSGTVGVAWLPLGYPLGMGSPRLLTIMGSGETAPTMAKVHRTLLARLASGPVGVAIVDTPYGFQENAGDLSARTVRFFEEKLGQVAAVASYLSRDVDAATSVAAVTILGHARYVMSGPGSPSYALHHWRGGPIPDALADLLRRGGGLTMASAAALTVGALTIPVYEIYKVGAPAIWLEGLDLLGQATGLRAAVVPHYDNAEGGTHDTRFCYIGERRLVELEGQIRDSTFVLGVDSHTAVTFDLDAESVSVAGRGGMTVRARGRSTVFPSGSEVPIATLAEVAAGLAAGDEVDIGWEPAPRVRRVARRAMAELSRSSLSAPAGRRAAAPRGVLAADVDAGPIERLVDDLTNLRGRLRADGDYATADALRDALVRSGFEVRDEAAAGSRRE